MNIRLVKYLNGEYGIEEQKTNIGPVRPNFSWNETHRFSSKEEAEQRYMLIREGQLRMAIEAKELSIARTPMEVIYQDIFDGFYR